MKARIAGDRRATEAWVRWRVRLYARRLSIEPPRIEFRALADRRAGYDPGTDTATFDVARHLCRHDADDSAAHECVHKRFPSLSHGARFDRVVKGVREGIRCGPPRSRLPKAFR